jgi:hypothetical protein
LTVQLHMGCLATGPGSAQARSQVHFRFSSARGSGAASFLVFIVTES